VPISSSASADGSRLANLTQDVVREERQEGSADPVWSPNGTEILFDDERATLGGWVEGLATIRPDGTRRRGFVSDAPQGEHQPDWESVSRGHRDRDEH
jgi:hypothetical protein